MRQKVRHTIYLEKKMSVQLMQLSEKTGAKPTEIVRRALAEYLQKRGA